MSTRSSLSSSSSHFKTVVKIKGFAARAVISGIDHACLRFPPLDKNGAKFSVTIKPEPGQCPKRYISNQPLTSTTPTLCQCEEKIISTQKPRYKIENGREAKSMQSAFRLLANSNFYTIDKNYKRTDATITTTVTGTVRLSDLKSPEVEKNFTPEEALKAEQGEHKNNKGNEDQVNGSRETGDKETCDECARNALRNETNKSQNKRSDGDDRMHSDEDNRRLTGGNEFSYPHHACQCSKPTQIDRTQKSERSQRPQETMGTEMSEKPQKPERPQKFETPERAVETKEQPKRSRSKKRPRFLCACCLPAQKSDKSQLSASRTVLPPSQLDQVRSEELLRSGSTVPDFCKDDCTEFCRTVHNYPSPIGSSTPERKESGPAINNNKNNNNKNSDDTRLRRLEKQMEELQRDLRSIQKNLMPEKESLRYLALDARLTELKSVIEDLKRCCPYAVSNFPAESTNLQIGSEKVQNVQYYSPEKPLADRSQPATSAKKTQAVPEPKCKCIWDSDQSINRRMAMCFFGKMKQCNCDRCTCASKANVTEPEPEAEVEAEPVPKPAPAPPTPIQDKPAAKPGLTPKPLTKRVLEPHCSNRTQNSQNYENSSKKERINRLATVEEHSPLRAADDSNQIHSVDTSRFLKYSETPAGRPAMVLSRKGQHCTVEQPATAPELAADASYCRYCNNMAVPLVKKNLSEEVLQRISEISPPDAEVALMIVLQPDGLYHINMSMLRTGQWICCLNASEQAIREASENNLFQRILTFFIMDARNTPEQKKRMLGQTFEFVGDRRT